MPRTYIQDKLLVRDCQGECVYLTKDLIIGQYLYKEGRCYRKKDAPPVTLVELLPAITLPELGRDVSGWLNFAQTYDEFQTADSVFPTDRLLEDFDLQNLEDQFGLSVTSAQLDFLQNIDGDVQAQISTLTGLDSVQVGQRRRYCPASNRPRPTKCLNQ